MTFITIVIVFLSFLSPQIRFIKKAHSSCQHGNRLWYWKYSQVPTKNKNCWNWRKFLIPVKMPFLNISLVSESFPFYRFGFHFIFNGMLVVILMVKWWFHKQMVFIISFLYVIIIILILSCFIFLLYCSHHKKHWFPIIHFPFNVSLFTQKNKMIPNKSSVKLQWPK